MREMPYKAVQALLTPWTSLAAPSHSGAAHSRCAVAPNITFLTTLLSFLVCNHG